MDSSQITNILNRYNELTYKCICFNGPWCIGKSYAVDAADDKNRIAHISLSGIRTSEEIYSEIIDSVVGKMSISTIADKVVSSVMDIASTSALPKVNTAANIASGLMDKFVTKKSLLQAVLKKQNKCMIVVLDDFERVWDGIDITEVFRVVEFLTNQKNVKVAIIGDLTKLSGDIKDKFEKYSERYIERTYTITDISADIEWDSVELHVSKDFITV